MTVQDTLLRYESMLPSLSDSGWEKREWPHQDTTVGMRVYRLWRRMDGDDQLMLHRFVPEPGVHKPHTHPMAVAAHVLGPGEYEVGFVVNGICQARLVCDADFYYEMRTREVAHYVLPRSGPIYSVALWTEFPDREPVPSDPLQVIETLPLVEAVFARLWPL